jgi:hypothetical protein
MKFFKTVKEIRSRDGELYFRRFAIFEIQNVASLYIHTIYKADKDPYLHTHPWNFCGIILKGRYIEKTDRGLNLKSPGSIGIAGRDYCHKIEEIVEGPVTSLFLVWGKYKTWFYSLGKIPNEEYRKNKNKNNIDYQL